MQARGILAAAAAVALVTACATPPSPQVVDQAMAATMKSSFHDQGIAKLDRLQQDLGQSACSSATPPSEAVAARITEAAKSSVKWPAGGQYFGDWKQGETLAQNGGGMTWRERSADPSENGGSCYNCHQLSKEELSYGTIGPSLYNYGKNRGVRDIMAPTAQPIIEYTWMKLWNSKSYSACSDMPRFGHAKILAEPQLRDLMSLLLDPNSPINK